jgi:UDP-glucose 4-epimerase
MAILVTGGAGYIGSHTCIELLKAGEDIVVLDNLCNSSIAVVDRVSALAERDFNFYECDVRDKAGLIQIFTENTIEAVIHFAGLKAVGESVSKPLEYYDNNIGGTVTLLEVMKQFGVKKIVFSSSCTVYGSNTPPFSEDMPISLETTNPYGTSKLFIERILQDLAVSDSEWNIALLRYFNPIGAHESGLLGDDPNGIPTNLMPIIQRVAVGLLPKLSVYGNDYPTRDGTPERDYIHVRDLAAGHLRAMEKLRTPDFSGCGVWNLGTGTPYSVLDIVNAFVKTNGVDIPYEFAPRRQGDVSAAYCNPEKAAAELGFRTEKTLEDMCRDSWHFTQTTTV